MPQGIDRRRLLAAGLAGAIPVASAAATLNGQMPWTGGAAAPDTAEQPEPQNYVFFAPAESAFVEAAAARIIPNDELGPGAVEAGVPYFIDRQLAGEFGQATRWYMQGPWGKSSGTQGYQSRFTPAGMYRAAIRAIDTDAGRDHRGASFANLAAADQDAYLTRLENGQADLGNVDGKAFFTLFLQNVQEGFWSDPIYGGNRNMVGWKLIGFPGARYDNRPWVTRHGQPYPLPPVGLKGRGAWDAG